MEARNERLRLILSRVIGGDVLDVGCARSAVPRSPKEGPHCLHFHLLKELRNTRVRGMDVDRGAVEKLRDQGLDVVVGDAQDMHLDARFDTIVAGELIEHLANPGEFLEGCRQHLKPAGRLVLSTPNPFSIMYYLMFLKNFRHAFNPEHTIWLCPQTLSQLAERSGFRVREMLFADDLRPGVTPTFWYRIFAQIYKLCRPLLPKKTRNTIVAVLEPQ